MLFTRWAATCSCCAQCLLVCVLFYTVALCQSVTSSCISETHACCVLRYYSASVSLQQLRTLRMHFPQQLLMQFATNIAYCWVHNLCIGDESLHHHVAYGFAACPTLLCHASIAPYRQKHLCCQNPSTYCLGSAVPCLRVCFPGH